MSNILNHNRNLMDFILSNEDYWDFHLAQEMGYGYTADGLSTDCLSAYIDFNDPNCVLWDDVMSKNEYVWENAVSSDVELNYIGVTGVDNGFISYQKDRITNKEFLNIFLNSSYKIDNEDKRLRLRKVNGNNQIYDYSNNIKFIDGKDVDELNGGFYQGFFKIQGKDYQTLPYVIENGWNIDIRLKKANLKNDKLTINDTHPNNKGIFFYIGTRAENKWWEKYSVGTKFDKSQFTYTSDEYIENNYTTENQDINSSYMQEDDKQEEEYIEEVYDDDENQCQQSEDKFIDENYVEKEYYQQGVQNCNQYVDDDYLEKEEEIKGDETLLTSEGFDFNQPNIIQYDTDNKFLLFDRTKDGFTVDNWEEGTKVTMYDIKKTDVGNYFTLFDRTPDGYDINKIEKLIEENNKSYNVLKDIYRNALAFQIKDNGSIGFKYLVKDCDSKEENYKIEQYFSKEGIINEDEWYTISIKIIPLKQYTIKNPLCDGLSTTVSDKMLILIYVNGKLKLKSESLPMLNLKALDDLSDKQQGVPFSLSIGGGTQGLCDVINLNYRELPKYELPLEKEFCGSFIGYIQNFRFYTCPLNFGEIKGNYDFDTHY